MGCFFNRGGLPMAEEIPGVASGGPSGGLIGNWWLKVASR